MTADPLLARLSAVPMRCADCGNESNSCGHDAREPDYAAIARAVRMSGWVNGLAEWTEENTAGSDADGGVAGLPGARAPVRITAAEADVLLRAMARPRGALYGDDGLLIFVPGQLVNPMNASGWGWRKRSAWAREWKDKVAAALLEVGYHRGRWPAAAPKRIHLRAHVRRRFDSVDNLRATLKPTVDALHADWCRLIHTDADTGGHVFEYEQVLDRAWQGVELSVRLA